MEQIRFTSPAQVNEHDAPKSTSDMTDELRPLARLLARCVARDLSQTLNVEKHDDI